MVQIYAGLKQNSMNERLNIDKKITQDVHNKKPVSVNGLRDVGRDGIEPPTHGFSVHCSTD